MPAASFRSALLQDMVAAAQHTLPTSSADDATLVRYVIQPVAGATVDAARPPAPSAGVPPMAPPAGSVFTGIGAGAGLQSAAALAAAAQEIDL